MNATIVIEGLQRPQRGRIRRRQAGRMRPLWLMLSLGWPLTAGAAFEYHPYVTEGYEYNSNVFSLPSRAQAIADYGDSQRDDKLLRSVAGIDTALDLGDDKLSLGAEGRRFLYDRFSQLDHNEYRLDGRFDWKLFSIWDGALEARQERSMASFAYLNTTQLTMNRDRYASASGNVNVSPEWRIEGSVASHQLDSPLPGFPQYSLREGIGTLALKYLGLGKVTSGIQATYDEGRYRGAPDEPAYTQYTGVFTLHYVESGVTTFDGNVGYTRFKSHDANGDSVGGLSAELRLAQQLTGKTAVHAAAFRRVNTYLEGANAEVDSGAEAGADWQATTKIGVAANYDWIYSSYLALAPAAAQSSARRDHTQVTNLSIRYQALDALSLRLYGNYYNRSSNIDLDTFNQAIAGIELRLRLP